MQNGDKAVPSHKKMNDYYMYLVINSHKFKTDKQHNFMLSEGKVPVLVDHGANCKVVEDSGRINAYINDLYPSRDAQCAYQGPAADACGGIFPKLAQLTKNRDTSKTPELKQALLEELVKLNAYLCCDEHKGKKFLLGDFMSDLDCSILPKLLHVRVAGKEFKGFDIPQELTALHDYIKNGQMEPVWEKTCPPDEQIIYGWNRHNVLKET